LPVLGLGVSMSASTFVRGVVIISSSMLLGLDVSAVKNDTLLSSPQRPLEQKKESINNVCQERSYGETILRASLGIATGSIALACGRFFIKSCVAGWENPKMITRKSALLAVIFCISAASNAYAAKKLWEDPQKPPAPEGKQS
jgi:hypothetical protein